MKALIAAMLACAPLLLVAPGTGLAQGAHVALGSLRQDTGLPVDVTADLLTVDNADGTALFSGNVRVKQGEMRLAADEVRVEYDSLGKKVARLLAKGAVTFVAPDDAAEADAADYTIATGTIVLTGNVILTQGTTALSGERLTIRLTDGTAVMEGRVTTTFIPGDE